MAAAVAVWVGALGEGVGRRARWGRLLLALLHWVSVPEAGGGGWQDGRGGGWAVRTVGGRTGGESDG